MIEGNASTFVGMDVSRDTIAIALLRPGEHAPLELTIANTAEAVRRQVRRWGGQARCASAMRPGRPGTSCSASSAPSASTAR